MTAIVEIVLFFIAGDIAGLRAGGGTLAVTGVIAGSGLLLYATRLSAVGRRPALLGFFLLGLGTGGSAAHAAARDCRAAIPDGAAVIAIGLLDPGARPGQRALVSLESLRIRGQPANCRGEVRVRVPEGSAVESLAGAHVRIAGTWWKAARDSGWPQPAERAGTLSVRSLSPARDGHRHLASGLRLGAIRTVRGRFANQPALAESLLLARRESLDPSIREDFAAAGLAHLLAISGAHVGILTGLVVLVAGLLRQRPRPAASIGTGVAIAYVAFLGAPAAAARAALQGVALLTARLAQRPCDRLSVIAGAALVLVAADPMVPLEAGFQLSFAGVAALLLFASPIAKLLPAAWPAPLVSSLSATLAATAATAPIAAWHFGLVSFIGPASNLVAAPLLAASIPAMVIALLAGPIPVLARFLAGGAESLLAALRLVAHVAAGIPGGHARVTPDAVTGAVLAVAAFLLCGPALRPRFGQRHAEPVRSRRTRHLVRSGVAIAAWVIWPVLRPSTGLEIHVIDVGQGDAIAIRTPARHWILIDTGPASPTFDAGRQRVAPWLLGHGARRIDLLVLTHPDMDHIGGARALLETFPVAMVMDPAIATGKELYFETLDMARRRGGSWMAAEAGREIDSGDVVIRVLAPDSALLDGLHEANDFSVVLRLEYGGFSALLTGDAPEAIENRLVARYGAALDSDLLKVGHHGSLTSTGDSLLAAVRPDLALISVGRRNRYGHPAPAVLDRLARYGVPVARTDENGSLIVRVQPDGSVRLFAER